MGSSALPIQGHGQPKNLEIMYARVCLIENTILPLMLFNDITEKIHSNGIDVNSFELLKKHVRVMIELVPLVRVDLTVLNIRKYLCASLKNFDSFEIS